MMRDFETYVGPDFIQPGEERLLRSYQPAQPRVNRQPETEVLVAVKEIGKPLKIVQPGTAYLGRNAVHKLQQAGCYGGPAKSDVNRQPETEVLVAVKEIGKPLKIVQPGTAYLGRNAVHKLQQAGCCGCPENVGAELKDTKIQELNATIARLQAKCVDDEKKIQ
eukprot:294273_1